MPLHDILELIYREISQRERARTLVAGSPGSEVSAKPRGRPKGSTNKPQVVSVVAVNRIAKRTMSPEGKQRIAAAQKARWAKQKKSAAMAKKTGNASNSVSAKKTVKPAGKKARANKGSAARKVVAQSEAAFAVQLAGLSAEPGGA